MWIATTTGFYSAVAHKHDKDLLVVRSRALQDSDALAAWVNQQRTPAAKRLRLTLSCHHVIEVEQPEHTMRAGVSKRHCDLHGGDRTVKRIRPIVQQPTDVCEVLAYEQSDYPWRVIIRRYEWAAFLASEVAELDYTNYKNAVTAKQGRARHDIYSKVWSVLLGLERLPGAMAGHRKRAIPHPLFGSRRTLGSLAGLPPISSARGSLFDDADDDWWARQEAAYKDDSPRRGDRGHEDCTAHACISNDKVVCL